MKSVLGVFLLLLLGFAKPAEALRCNGRLVGTGDHALQVRERCGEPFWIDRYSEWLIRGERGPLEQRVERTVEVWFYNFGSNRFMQRMVFRDDRLQHEEQLDYGFDRAPRRCKLDALRPGMTNGEVIALCGQPARRSERYTDQIERDGQGNARVRVLRREDWVYDVGASQDYRLLQLIDGRLYEVERLDR